ncbi:MAG: CDP-alcohol phosphatidyltransferase family protein [Acidobacteria bacterium]|nr:CDP-alcohol phosphatidyltransferase family protein [Acidobacteriota bacterium]
MVIAFAVTVAFMMALRPVATSIGLIDRPGGRKSHNGDVPIIGGMAMFIGALSGLAVIDAPTAATTSLVIASVLLIAVGALDDRYNVPAFVRILVQVAAILVMTYGAGLAFIGGAIGVGLLISFALPILERLFNVLTDGHIPFWAGALIAYGIVVVYVVTSGVRGAAWSDVLQAILMLVIAWALGLYLVETLHGGTEAMFTAIAADRPDFLLIGKEGSVMSAMTYSSAIVVSTIGFVMWPHLFTKSYTTTERRIKLTVIAYPVFAIFLVPVLMVFLLTKYVWMGLAVFLAASVTDWLDGHLARKRRQVTIDPAG